MLGAIGMLVAWLRSTRVRSDLLDGREPDLPGSGLQLTATFTDTSRAAANARFHSGCGNANPCLLGMTTRQTLRVHCVVSWMTRS